MKQKQDKHSGRALLSLPLLAVLLWLAGCAATRPPSLSEGHLTAPPPERDGIPSAVSQAPVLPEPKAVAPLETYTVVVSEVPVKDLLFELARDAKLNVDVHPGLEGVVSLNAVNQTLPQILDRVAKQASLRYTLDGPNLVVGPDLPYWRSYQVNYVNMSRESTGEVSVATQISTAGGSVGEGGATTEQGNVSSTKVKNISNNNFWQMVEANLKGLLGVGGASAVGAQDQASPVIVNSISGVISVNATQRQHEQIQAFLDQVVGNALRQVLIEMTIVEVELSDRYQAGVDWQSLARTEGLNAISTLAGSALSAPPAFAVNYTDVGSQLGNVSATLRMLESFGDAKVLSSPKVMALNNQTALLKVVDEKVYFTVELEIQDATDTTPERRTYISTIHTVPVGMVMSVTPQVNPDNNVTLNIRPTISRITGFATDPAPRLAQSNFDNLIPEIQVREMESLLQVASGQMVVMGGLMQNKTDKNKQGVPLLSALPWIGHLFSFRDDDFTKTELVIFLRPTVVKGAALGFKLEDHGRHLPGVDISSPRQEAISKNKGGLDTKG